VWTTRIADEAITMSPGGDAVTVDVHDLVLTDDQGSAGVVPASASFKLTWKGHGRQRQLASDQQAPFAGTFFRRATARGTFGASTGSFTFASKPVRSVFAELGSERNGTFLGGALRCTRCGAPPVTGWGGD
jgi:hypothetical protein